MSEDLKIKIQEQTKDALKARDQVKREVLNMLLTSIKNKELEKRGKFSSDIENRDEASQLSEEEILQVIGSELKKRRESIETYRSAGREDLADKEEVESNILLVFLPEQMGEDEIKTIIREVIAETEAKSVQDLGKVMSMVIQRTKGKADGATVNKLAKEELSQT